jgi:hypothetical protein
MEPSVLILLLVATLLVVWVVDVGLVVRLLSRAVPSVKKLIDPCEDGDLPKLDWETLAKDPERLRRHRAARQALVQQVVANSAGHRRKAMLLALIPVTLLTAALGREAYRYRGIVEGKERMPNSLAKLANDARRSAINYFAEALADARYTDKSFMSENIEKIDVEESVFIDSDQRVRFENRVRISRQDPRATTVYRFEFGRLADARPDTRDFDVPREAIPRITARTGDGSRLLRIEVAEEHAANVPSAVLSYRRLERNSKGRCEVRVPPGRELGETLELEVEFGWDGAVSRQLVGGGGFDFPLSLSYGSPYQHGVPRVNTWQLTLHFKNQIEGPPKLFLVGKQGGDSFAESVDGWSVKRLEGNAAGAPDGYQSYQVADARHGGSLDEPILVCFQQGASERFMKDITAAFLESLQPSP